MHITSIATQVRVTDLERSLRFYTGVLGFEEEFRFEGFYAGIRSGETRLHLKLVDDPDPSIAFVREGDHLHLYLRVDDVDVAFRELQGRAEVVYPITTKPWGSRELTIEDPDGHTLYIGQAAPVDA
jgi:catechol 2,3-dioxygenase-like lactoylglutathione lyase family enzyme